MTNFYKRFCTTAFAITLLIGVCCFAIGALVGVTWTKSEVIPVVIVEPGIGGFKPMTGSSIGNRWFKSLVKPVLLVKPGIGGFVPLKGSSIGNSWGKKDVLPVVIVEPSMGRFVPLRPIATRGESTSDALHTIPPTISVVENKIVGDFEGWEGETIVRLENGQIWQQSEYHYAFMPEVLIFKSGSGHKMIVDGVKNAVGVDRLK